MSELLAENWQFLILLFGFIALGWNITRSNRDMSLKVATNDDIAQLEDRITSLWEELANSKSRIDGHETLIERNAELLEQATHSIKKNVDNIDRLIGLYGQLLDKIS